MRDFLICCCCFILMGNTIVAQQQSEIDSLQECLKTSTAQEKTEVLNRLSMLYQSISPEKSIEYDLQNLEHNRKLGKLRNQSTILNNLAISYYLSGQYYKSIELFDQSLAILEEFNDTLVIMKTLNNLGVLTQTIGQYDKSLDYLQRSLQYKYNQNDTVSIAKTLNNIGVINMKMAKNEEAKMFFMQAFNYYTVMDDQGNLADIYNNLGQLYNAEDKPDSALMFYNNSLDIKKMIGDERGKANTLNNIGIIYSNKKMNDKALRYFNEARSIRAKIGDTYGLASTINNLANLQLSNKNYNKALDLFNSSNDIALDKKLNNIAERNYAGISLTYEKIGEFAKALKYFKLQEQLKDSMYTEDFNNQLADLNIQYEVKENERENKILRQENEIQLLQISLYNKQKILLIIALFLILLLSLAVVLYITFLNRRKNAEQLKVLNIELQRRVKERTSALETANKTKDQFLSIIAHDLKTPFNSILGFSEILSHDYDKIDDNKRKELAVLINNSGHNIYKLLDNLLSWATLQNGNIKLHTLSININDVINETLNTININANDKDIKINIRATKDHIVLADDNSVKTILRNILSNAIKFNYRGGEINVDIDDYSYMGKEYVKLKISDNGIGISEENLSKIFNFTNKFRTQGTEDELGTGFGLVLCQEFIKMNKGRLWAESKLGEGSTFYFTLPKG